MKKLLIFILLFPFSSFAQISDLPIDSSTSLITYSGVVQVAGDKTELYSRAREWFAKAYKSSTNVIQMDDKESGKIVGKALMQVYHRAFGKDHVSGFINYTISVYIKDGRYKYEVANFYHTGQYVGDGITIPDFGTCEEMIHAKKKSYQKTFNYYLSQMDENIKALILNMKENMSKQNTTGKKDNW